MVGCVCTSIYFGPKEAPQSSLARQLEEFPGTVLCPGQPARNYCDCDGDCAAISGALAQLWCSCPDALTCCAGAGAPSPPAAAASLVAFGNALDEAICPTPRWHTVYSLDTSTDACPGTLQPSVVPSLEQPGTFVRVCGRGERTDVAQAGAVIAQGYTYSQIRGSVTAYAMGSPDSFRPESWREALVEPTIDDPYMDGVGFARLTSNGRVHVATYVAGLSYTSRSFSYFINSNCMCHGGSELPPSWLGDDYYCDSALRGGTNCSIGANDDDGCINADDCAAAGCGTVFQNARWYGPEEAVPLWTSALSEGYICRGSRYATAGDFQDRPFGSFHYETPTLAWVTDPIEVRVMAGQPSGSETVDGMFPGNEDTAIRALQLEV